MKDSELRQLRTQIDGALALFRQRESRLTPRELRFQRRLQLLYDEITEELEAKEPKPAPSPQVKEPPPPEPQGYL